MLKSKKKEQTLYDDSLARIFLKSGSTVFIFLLIGCALLFFVMLYQGNLYPEGIKLLGFCFVFSILCSYGPAAICLFKAFAMERTLGLFWKDRTDQDLPAQERDWYLDYDRGGFILCHRAYIKRILGSQVESENTSYIRGTVHCVLFEDLNGKQHTLRFSSESTKRSFQQWYHKQEGRKKRPSRL